MTSSVFQNFPVLFAAAIFIVFCLVFIGLMYSFRELQLRRERFRKLANDRDHESILRDSVLVESAGHHHKVVDGFMYVISKPFIPRRPEEYSRMNMKFINAGLRSSNVKYVFWGIKAMLMIIFPFLFLALRLAMFPAFHLVYTYVATAYLLLMGFYLPDVWLAIRIRIHKRKIFEALPDALDLLVVCVEAGLGLDSAITRVADDIILTSTVLSEELKIVNLEIRAGKPRAEALRNLALRTDLDDVNSLCTLLIQTERFGTSLAPALRVYADSFRTKRFQAAEEMAAKLPVKLLFPLILFIFPALFVVIAGPAVITFIRYFSEQ
jgi:tight adherence protein C